MVPSGDLAGATTTRTVAGEAEAQVGLIRDEAGATGVEDTLQQDQHRHVNREGMNVVNHEVGGAERHGSSGNLAANGDNGTVEHFTYTGELGAVLPAAAACTF